MPAAGGKRRGGKNTGVVAKKKKTLAPPQVEWANGSSIRYSAKARSGATDANRGTSRNGKDCASRNVHKLAHESMRSNLVCVMRD
jgi:hypothetical protein